MKKRVCVKKRGRARKKGKHAVIEFLEHKGQTAMEFLMTYGWAVLAVMVIIAALTHYNIIDIASVTPERATISTGFDIADYEVSDGGIEVELKNTAGKDIVIEEITFISDALGGECTTGPITTSLILGETKSFTAADPAACSDTGSGGKNKYNVKIMYSLPGSSGITHITTGELLTSVEGRYHSPPSGFAVKSLGGVDDKVFIPASASLDVTDETGLTLEAWLKLDALEGLHYIMDKCGPGGYCWAVEPVNPQTLEYCPTVQFGSGWLVWSTSCQTAPSLGEWTHLALTYSPSHEIVFYKNGEIIDDGTLASQYTISSGLLKDLVISGCDSTVCRGVDGITDEVRIYGKVLPPSLIEEHYNGDFSGDSSGCGGDCDLRALWHFDEGINTTAADSSGNENNGTLINNPAWVSVP